LNEEERMYHVELYSRIRRECLVEGKSVRKASEEFGINRRTIRKMLKHPNPPGYQHKKGKERPKLGSVLEMVHQIIEEDKNAPKKQRHTAKRVFERVKEEKGYSGSYSTLRKYIHKYKGEDGTKEVFCPLEHEPGESQVDFGEAWVFIGGDQQKAHFFVMDLPQSDACFVKGYPKENTESFCDGHAASFVFFGGVPSNILYDNTGIAVSFVMGKRKKTRAFCELQSHYLFKEKFARVRKGSDKGSVEGLVGFARRNFLVPIPHFESYEDLNKYLEICCLKRQKDLVYGEKETIEERLKRDKAVFLPLPETPYEACVCQPGRVSSQALVRFKGNDYSVPVRYGYRDVWIKGYVNEVVISCGVEIIARHKRCYGMSESIFNPLHYLPLLEEKVGALDQAAPLKKWDLPAVFGKLQNILETRKGKEGKREYVRVLRLLENGKLEELEGAIEDALNLGVVEFEVIRHLLLCKIDHRPPHLNMMDYPHLPTVIVKTTQAMDYNQLLGGSRC
jgi:transposase